MTRLTTEEYKKFSALMDKMTLDEKKDLKAGNFPARLLPDLNAAGVKVDQFYKYVKLMLV